MKMSNEPQCICVIYILDFHMEEMRMYVCMSASLGTCKSKDQIRSDQIFDPNGCK